MSIETNGSKNKRPSDNSEVRLQAKAVSRGIAIGRIVWLHGTNRQYFRIRIDDSRIGSEIKRLNNALKIGSRQLKKLIQSDPSKAESSVGIFEAHLMILEDPSLLSKIETTIKKEKVNAEWALKLVADEYISRYRAIADDHLRERYIDIEDVVERLMNALGGNKRSYIGLESDSVIVAKELRPSTIVELHENRPVGLITEHGGWTSHTFILAREVNIPAVTGLKKALRRLDDGAPVIIDGYRGQVILNPSTETKKEYEAAAARTFKPATVEIADESGTLKTLDGREITIRVNADLPRVYRRSLRMGARGIGLFRSEFLFNRYGGFPTEHQQYEAYRRLGEAAGSDGVRIRTFDIGVGQLLDRREDRERNPALGLRGVRLSFAYPKQLRIQLRAILRASKDNSIDLVIPMITGVADIRRVIEMLDKEREDLANKGIEFGTPKIGAMIEVPAAVFEAVNIFKEIEFACLGTNDLIQYLLAADRDNETVANWYRTLEPSVIKAIRSILDAGRYAKKPVILCGEMAGSPFYTPVLVGLGATDLSMNFGSISHVRRIVAGIAYDEARDLVKKIDKCVTTDEIEETVRTAIRTKWSHLYPSDQVF
jgi:phosphoenolpyruvate-protein phosphotransferase (PTS system enzyme I)